METEADAVIESSSLENRMARGAETVQADLRRAAGRKAKPEAPELAARLAAARALLPPEGLMRDSQHCGHCWGTGRDAAVRAIAEAEAEGA